ncbi:hypothetical protein LX36DRAFT_123389 [Colletotrichum falcatum]|nr:hypothetical protein LX36DRAFT_123389 [Colletotrichum falcatum]
MSGYPPHSSSPGRLPSSGWLPSSRPAAYVLPSSGPGSPSPAREEGRQGLPLRLPRHSLLLLALRRDLRVLPGVPDLLLLTANTTTRNSECDRQHKQEDTTITITNPNAITAFTSFAAWVREER